ncbi:hypothetical protein [Deefgea rivuli]|uniref:hypothetical protein n=1 Tax=Deefgea rivuli TaxID=400948 RepID=UPI00048A0F42|nr:hypothetical protein [Deefgea rivuli]
MKSSYQRIKIDSITMIHNVHQPDAWTWYLKPKRVKHEERFPKELARRLNLEPSLKDKLGRLLVYLDDNGSYILLDGYYRLAGIKKANEFRPSNRQIRMVDAEIISEASAEEIITAQLRANLPQQLGMSSSEVNHVIWQWLGSGEPDLKITGKVLYEKFAFTGWSEPTARRMVKLAKEQWALVDSAGCESEYWQCWNAVQAQSRLGEKREMPFRDSSESELTKLAQRVCANNEVHQLISDPDVGAESVYHAIGRELARLAGENTVSFQDFTPKQIRFAEDGEMEEVVNELDEF